MGCQQAGQEQEDDDLTGHHRFPADPFQQRWIYWRAYWQHFDAARRPGGAREVHGKGSGHPSIRYDWEGYVRHRPGWEGGSDGDLSAEIEDGASVSQPVHAAPGVHWEKGLVNGAACEVVPTDPAFLGGAGH